MKEGRNTAKKTAVGTAVTILTALVLLLLASFLTVRGVLPEEAVKPCVIAACAVGSIMGSAAARGRNPGRSAAAAGQGIVCAAAVLTAGALLSKESGMDGFAAIVLCTLLIPAVSAALLTRKRRRKHR